MSCPIKMASTREIRLRISSKTTVSYLGLSMLSYTFPRNINPIPALIVTEYLNSLQFSPVTLGPESPPPPIFYQLQPNQSRIYSYLIRLNKFKVIEMKKIRN